MKHSYTYEQWTNPALGGHPSFHHLSYALFRTDGEMGRVVAARCPDRHVLAVDTFMQADLKLSDEAWMYLLHANKTDVPMFVRSDMGLGILSKRYDLDAGLGIYFHIHCRPDAGARLLNSGALGTPDRDGFTVSNRVRAAGGEMIDRDADSYPALADAWQTVRFGCGALLPTGQNDTLDTKELQSVMRGLASFAGCGISFPQDMVSGQTRYPSVGRVKCYRPLLLEALLLYLLTEVREYAATRTAECRIGSSDGTDGGELMLTLRYPLASAEMSSQQSLFRSNVRSHLSYVAELGGLDVHFAPVAKPISAKEPRHSALFPEQTVILEWLTDPSVLPTSDLKAHLRLRYEGRDKTEL